jgi:tetratricopeptide (TPR) repeat protein
LRAQAATPWPEYAAALHHLYGKLGRTAEAGKQLALLDVIDRMGNLAREKGNRALVYIFADLDHRLDRAVELARGELEVRRDVYTYDALSWAYFKAGLLDEAAVASAKAMAHGTPEPAFFYHAGLIAQAKGDRQEAARLLERALALNPHFDLVQADRASAVLRSIKEGSAVGLGGK